MKRRITNPYSLITNGFLLLALIPLMLEAQIRTGAEQLEKYLPLLEGKRIGIVANHASVVGGVNTVDTLVSSGCRIKKIFSPEHGFRLQAAAGEIVANGKDSLTGLTIVSLYGKKRKPATEDLDGLDLVLFDIQDVGVRFYTYISTLTFVMEACAEQGIPVVVLDRPNPNGFYIDGPVLEKEFSSFVGLHPVPVVYGMTIGEYAQMVNGEQWLKNGIQCELTVIPLAGWTHHTFVELQVPPSPNLTDMNAIYLYPSLCFFEGTGVSIGRGTCFPFEVFGHPEMKGFAFSFVPESIPGVSLHPPWEGLRCFGLDLRDFYQTHPTMFGRINLAWVIMAFRDLGSSPDFFTPYFDKLAGNNSLRNQILEGLPESIIRVSWQDGLEKFKQIRAKYLLYE
ncbi:MAG: DUF1343 domain-containing protein [bacterium]